MQEKTLQLLGVAAAVTGVFLLAKKAGGTPPIDEPDWSTFPDDGNPYWYFIFTDYSVGWFDSDTSWYLIVNEYDYILKYWGPYTEIP